MQSSLKRGVLVVVGGLFLVGCGGGGSNPAAPPTPTPTPTPDARPTPTPEPPTGLACGVPPMEDPPPCAVWAKAKKPNFLPEVIGAIDTLKRERPDLFLYSGKDNKVVTVRLPNVYLKALATTMERDYGLCVAHTIRGLPRDEIFVKNSNQFAEHYDVLTGDNQVWWGWTVTCKPATF